jgi:hypothetical protein
MKHAHIWKTGSILWRDRCSRHQWLHSYETSRVYVRCSRTKSMQAGVRSAVPRTTPTTKNWSGWSEQSRVRSLKTWSPVHPCKCTSADNDFGGLLSHSLCARRRWDGNSLIATRLRDYLHNRKNVTSFVLIHWQREGRRATTSNSRAIRARNLRAIRAKNRCAIRARNRRPLLGIRQETCGHHDSHHSRQNAQPFGRKIQTNVQ